MASRPVFWLSLWLVGVAVSLAACGSTDSGVGGGGGGGTGGSAGEGGSGPPTAIEILNGYRARMELPAIGHDWPLAQAARAHADYYLTNLGDPTCEAASPHDEIPDCPGFTGENVLDRALAAGFSGSSVGECIHFVNDPEQSVYDWLISVYHRFCIASPEVEAGGYAADDGIDVLDVSFGSSAPQLIARWPVPGDMEVARSWDGAESPTPPSPPGGYPSGPILGIIFGPEDDAHITDATLTYTAYDIPSTFLSPDNDFYLVGTAGYFLYADQPLAELREYTVSFRGTRAGSSYTDTWSFFVPCDATGPSGGRTCAGNILQSCDHGDRVELDCGGDVCLEYPTGARCVTSPITACAQPDGAFVRCDGSRILRCEGGYELLGQECIDGICQEIPTGATCASLPVTPCASQEEQRLRCEGEAMVICKDGYIQYKSCGELYCNVNQAGTSAFCGAAPLSCTVPRCAGLIPIQCVSHVEVASLICDEATSTCTIDAGQAVCAPL